MRGLPGERVFGTGFFCKMSLLRMPQDTVSGPGHFWSLAVEEHYLPGLAFRGHARFA